MRTEYQILLGTATKLGDSPTAVGERLTRDFTLPDNFIETEHCIIMCRTLGCNGHAALFFNGSANEHQVGNILEPHNGVTNDEWMTDLAIVGSGKLRPGSNYIYIVALSPSGNNDIDDFTIDNIVLWYTCADPRFPWPWYWKWPWEWFRRLRS